MRLIMTRRRREVTRTSRYGVDMDFYGCVYHDPNWKTSGVSDEVEGEEKRVWSPRGGGGGRGRDGAREEEVMGEGGRRKEQGRQAAGGYGSCAGGRSRRG